MTQHKAQTPLGHFEPLKAKEKSLLGQVHKGNIQPSGYREWEHTHGLMDGCKNKYVDVGTYESGGLQCCSVVRSDWRAELNCKSDLRTNQALIWLNEKEEGEEDTDDFISLKQNAHHPFTDRLMLTAHKNGKSLFKLQSEQLG